MSSRGHGTPLTFKPAFKTPEGCSPVQSRTFALLSKLPAELSPTTHLPDLAARPQLLSSCAPQKRTRFLNVLTEKLHRRCTAHPRLSGKPTPSQNCVRCQETLGRAANGSSPSPTAWLGARLVLVTSLPLTSQPLACLLLGQGPARPLLLDTAGPPRHSRHSTCHLLVQRVWVQRRRFGPAAPSQPSPAMARCSQQCHRGPKATRDQHNAATAAGHFQPAAP